MVWVLIQCRPEAWISFLAECWEMGLINEKDTNGLKIEWGDGEVLVKLTEKIAKLEGIGKWFEEGIQGASKNYWTQIRRFNCTY